MKLKEHILITAMFFVLIRHHKYKRNKRINKQNGKEKISGGKLLDSSKEKYFFGKTENR